MLKLIGIKKVYAFGDQKQDGAERRERRIQKK